MMAKKETAEQKLLKMIESSGSTSASPSTKPDHKKVSKKQGTLSLIRFFNKLLIVAVIIAALFLGNEIYAGVTLMNKNVTFSVKPMPQFTQAHKNLPSSKDASSYLAQVSNRNLFQPYEKVEVAKPEEAEGNKKITQKVKNLRLVGISWLDRVDTASVMVEDSQKQVTYFLMKGEKLGDLTVKTIYAESALLGYENEEILIKYDKPKM